MAAIDLTLTGPDQTLVLFFFVLAIIFGILEITRIFKNKAVNFIIAFALAFFAVNNASFVQFIVPQFGLISAFFIIMFFIAFVLEVFGLRGPKSGKPAEERMIINGAILLLLMVFGFMNASLIPELPYIGSGTNLIVLVALIIILVIFWLAFKAGPEHTQLQGRKKER